MCWTCCIENLKAQIAKEDINVCKVVRKADKESCVSLFIGYTYYKNSIHPSRILEVRVGSSYSFAEIKEGYYSYSSVNFVCDSIAPAYEYKTLEIMYDSKKRPHKIVIYSRRRVGMAAVDLDANTYK